MVAFTAQQPAYSAYDIGEWTHGTPVVLSWGEGTTLRVGRFCSFANNVVILLGGEHRTDWVTTYPFSAIFRDASGYTGHPRTRGDVVIGHDVWLGLGALILSGVTIGNGAVVGAASVATRGVEPYSIVAGNPARHVRYRFDEHQRQALQQIRWWDRPAERIAKAWPELLCSDIDRFISLHGDGVAPRAPEAVSQGSQSEGERL